MNPVLRRAAERPRITAAVIALLVVAGAGTYWLTRDGSTNSAAAATTRLVSASLGTVRESVSSTGTIEPAHQESLSFPASGRVTSVKVAQGDSVTAGQVLATIDSASLKANLAQLQAGLATAQAKVASDGAGSVTSTQLAADQAAVTAAQGQVSSAKTTLAGASLTSPIAGVVATVNVATGDQVSGGSSGSSAGQGGSTSGGQGGSTGGQGGSTSGGQGGSTGGQGGTTTSSSASSTAQFLVISTDSWVVNATVDDTQVSLIAKGNQAQITTTGATNAVYGTVGSVGLIASSSSGSASYPVVVNVTGSPSGLHAGASATVALIYRQLTNVLTVPSLAVHTSGGASYVYVMTNGQQTKRTLTVGLAASGSVQVKSGLIAGEQVVVQVATPTGVRAGTGTRTGGVPGGVGFGGGGFSGGAGGFGGGGGLGGN